MLTFRSRPKHLELRRTSSCSALPVNGKNSNNPSSSKENHLVYSLVHHYTKHNRQGLLHPLSEGVEHISELLDSNPQCQFCDEKCSKEHRDCTKLKIVSRGVVCFLKIYSKVFGFLLSKAEFQMQKLLEAKNPIIKK